MRPSLPDPGYGGRFPVENGANIFGWLYPGVVASGGGFYLWNTGAVEVKPGVLAVMNNLKSPLAVVMSVIFLSAWACMALTKPETPARLSLC